MPKQKTCKAVAKRYRKTASGKLKNKKAGTGHLLGGKSRKRKRQLRKSAVVSRAEEKRLRHMI